MATSTSSERRKYTQLRLEKMKKTVDMAGTDLQNLVLRPSRLYVTQGAPAASADSTAVLTAANVLTGIVTCDTSVERVKATDTATNFVDGLGLDTDGDSFDFSFINTEALHIKGVVELTAGTGVTIVGSPIIQPSVPSSSAGALSGTYGSAMFRIRRTGATAVSLYRIA
jgi:hypothetical protein